MQFSGDSQDIENLFNVLDAEKKGFLTYDEFLGSLNGAECKDKLISYLDENLKPDKSNINFDTFKTCIERFYTSLSDDHREDLDELDESRKVSTIYDISQTDLNNSFENLADEFCEDFLSSETPDSAVGTTTYSSNTFSSKPLPPSFRRDRGHPADSHVSSTIQEIENLTYEHEELRKKLEDLESQVQLSECEKKEARNECLSLGKKILAIEDHLRQVEINWREKLEQQEYETKERLAKLEQEKNHEINEYVTNDMSSYILKKLESLESKSQGPYSQGEIEKIIRERDEALKELRKLEKDLNELQMNNIELESSFERYRQSTGKQVLEMTRERNRAVHAMEQLYVELEVTKGRLQVALGQPIALDGLTSNQEMLSKLDSKGICSKDSLTLLERFRSSSSNNVDLSKYSGSFSSSKANGVSENDYEELAKKLTMDNKMLTELIQHLQNDLFALRAMNKQRRLSRGDESESDYDQEMNHVISAANKLMMQDTNKSSLAEEIGTRDVNEIEMQLKVERETVRNLKNYMNKILERIFETQHTGLLEIVMGVEKMRSPSCSLNQPNVSVKSSRSSSSSSNNWVCMGTGSFRYKKNENVLEPILKE